MSDESHTGRRLTVQQAADTLGVTLDAIRGRLRRGTIESVREGGRVYVILTGDEAHTVRDQPTGQYTPTEEESSQQSPRSGTPELLEELQDRVRYLERSLDQEREARREESRELRRLLAASLERIPPQLEAPSESPRGPETPVENTESVDTPDREEAARPRSWWRRFFGFE